MLLTAAPLGVCGCAAQPDKNSIKSNSSNRASLKQLENQMKSLKNEFKVMNNNNNNNKGQPEKIVVDDNTSKQVLKAICDMKKELNSSNRALLLSSAIRNAEYNSFEYFVIEDGPYESGTYSTGDMIHSANTVRSMLFRFQSGFGFTVSESCLHKLVLISEDEKESN